MGFTAVRIVICTSLLTRAHNDPQIWISPITYNLEGDTGVGEAYHGYWQQDLYRLNENFGTAEELKALSTALHDRDMVRHYSFACILQVLTDSPVPYGGRRDESQWLGRQLHNGRLQQIQPVQLAGRLPFVLRNHQLRRPRQRRGLLARRLERRTSRSQDRELDGQFRLQLLDQGTRVELF